MQKRRLTMAWTVLVIVDTIDHVLVLQHISLTHNSVVGFAKRRFRDCTAAYESSTSFEAWLLELPEDCGRVLGTLVRSRTPVF